MWLHGAAVFSSAFLLFQVQPLVARAISPSFGGTAAVWTVCLLFFQLGLLAGYFYGWATRRLLAPRARATLHAVLLAASAALLPIAIAPNQEALPPGAPTTLLLLRLTQAIGLPYVLLAASTPVFQEFHAARFRREPYGLFAVSNAGSLLALLSYPLLIAPHLGVRRQALWWSIGDAAFLVMGVALALDARRRASPRSHEPRPVPAGPADERPPGVRIRALWLLLPACGTALLASITNHLAEEVAPIPLLWVVPLSLYLLTFILAFARRRLYPRRLAVAALLAALPLFAWLRARSSHPSLALPLTLWLAGLFAVCLVLHGELARLRPAAHRLTAYYLLLSLGGALGGLFIAVVAPLVLANEVELEVTVLACGACACVALFTTAPGPHPHEEALRPPSVLDDPAGKTTAAVAWLLGLAAALALSIGQRLEEPRLAVRNFYGALRVVDLGSGPNAVRKLLHGTINHGGQWRAPGRTREPVTYYCDDSGIAQAFERHHADRPRAVGVIGLGAGSLAVYGRKGDRFRFYEINPAVEPIARTWFTYLGETPAAVDVVTGDARLMLAGQEPNRFDLLVLDAFAGDAIPVHLVTREAFALYFRHLAPDGVLAVHISNRHLDLEPLVAEVAAASGRTARLVEGDDHDERYCFFTRWALLAADPALFADPPLSDAEPLHRRPGFRTFTDDEADLLSLVR